MAEYLSQPAPMVTPRNGYQQVDASKKRPSQSDDGNAKKRRKLPRSAKRKRKSSFDQERRRKVARFNAIDLKRKCPFSIDRPLKVARTYAGDAEDPMIVERESHCSCVVELEDDQMMFGEFDESFEMTSMR